MVIEMGGDVRQGACFFDLDLVVFEEHSQFKFAVVRAEELEAVHIAAEAVAQVFFAQDGLQQADVLVGNIGHQGGDVFILELARVDELDAPIEQFSL